MDTEKSRLKMSRDQPATQHNYTEVGFLKRKLPEDIFKTLKDFFDNNVANKHEEKWGRGYTYTNHWIAPTYMVSVEDNSLIGAGQDLKAKVWDGIRPIIEQWTGHKVKPTSMYGIRVYTEGAILATHVDRLPLVSSCIVNVAQDVVEPWPIEVYDHDGRAVNVTMEAGDMVLYESSTVLHGRPAPLKGKYFANIFIHYEPLDHKQMNKQDQEMKSVRSIGSRLRGGGTEPQIVSKEGEGEGEGEEGAGSEEDFSAGGDYNLSEEEKRLALNFAAARGDLSHVKSILVSDHTQAHSRLHLADHNGWQAIHEAVRAGHTEVVKYLVQMGADIGALTESGGTPLYWAKRSLPKGHSTIRYLEDIGAPDGEEL